MHDLRKISMECVAEMKAVGIPVQDERIIEVKAGDAGDSLGMCSRNKERNFTITIREDLLHDECPLKDLKEVIIHELIHTCKGCFSHSKTWRKYAEVMNNMYGYSLLEDKDELSIFQKEKPILHRYVCPKCGSIFNSRESGDYDYRCSFCNSWYEEVS